MQTQTTPIFEFKKYKVLGYTTDFNQCECCGKSDLKGTVSILDLNCDVVYHFGSTCAASIDKYDTLEAARQAKKEIIQVINYYREMEKVAACRAHKDERLKEIKLRKGLTWDNSSEDVEYMAMWTLVKGELYSKSVKEYEAREAEKARLLARTPEQVFADELVERAKWDAWHETRRKEGIEI